MEMKNNKNPIITFGCPKGRLNFESKNPNETKIKGRSREVQENK